MRAVEVDVSLQIILQINLVMVDFIARLELPFVSFTDGFLNFGHRAVGRINIDGLACSFLVCFVDEPVYLKSQVVVLTCFEQPVRCKQVGVVTHISVLFQRWGREIYVCYQCVLHGQSG